MKKKCEICDSLVHSTKQHKWAWCPRCEAFKDPKTHRCFKLKY